MILAECPACGAKHTPGETNPDGSIRCARCGGTIVPGPATCHAETVASPPADPDNRPTLPDRGETATESHGPISIPGYAVLEEVGRGGMGVVYKARQFNPPRLVALKMIHAGEHADPEQLARFRTEAEAIARLAHPSITHIHQVGEWHPPGGGPAVPFLTLEYVAGTTLASRLKSGPPVEPRQAAGLIRRLAEGVHYAHQQGIVHRDLKPGNILLTGEEGPDSLGDPKIVDFGLAKPLDGFASTVSDGPQTRTGSVLGTPGYMAPEQAASKKTIGPPADVYALGAILYELLTGRPPFEGESTLETLLRVTSEEPVQPRSLRPKIPRDLETVCLTCLAKEPERRYPSAQELAKDLGRFLADRPVKVRPPSRRERLARWVRRHKELTYLAAGALGALAVVSAVVFTRPNPPDASLAEAPKPPPQQPPNPGPPDEDTDLDQSRRRLVSQGNLKQLAVALHNFEAANGHLPPAAITDKDGKPLLSWRVAILPYIEQEALYKQFKLDEPWDSPNNKPLVEKIPKIYRVEGQSGPANTTHYQAIVGKGTAWEPLDRIGQKVVSFTDGSSNTILVAEVAKPVVWSKPDDMPFPTWENPSFGGIVKGGFSVAMADGSVKFVRDGVPQETLAAAITRSGGEVLPDDWDKQAAASGASRGPGPPTGGTGFVTGRVTYKGRPVAGGRIQFQGGEAAPGATGQAAIGEDGKYNSPGLPPGVYRVAIIPPPGTPRNPISVPTRYSSPETSPLTVTLQPGMREADFELTDDPKKK
jgi:serine/threonine protein kinase